MRRARGLPSLRAQELHRVLTNTVRATPREGFRIVHYSVQADHVHMLVEAEDRRTLSSGMRSFAVRSAILVNRLMSRRVLGRGRGQVWAERYHRRDLKSPREVRSALVYVLANHLKHGEVAAGLLDPCSSGRWFDGWLQTLARPPDPPPAQPPSTWLLHEGWQRAWPGLIHLGELPRAARE